MTQKNSSKIISVVHPICCGLDVHKDMLSACIIIKYGKSFVDLGEVYLMSKSKEKRIKALKSRAKYLGFNLVPLEVK